MTEDKQIEEMAEHCCFPCDFYDGDGECVEGKNPCKCGISLETANKLYAAGYRKKVEGYWRVVSYYTDGTFYTHSILTCSVCGTKQTTVTSMFPNHCYECGSRMTETVLEKVIRLEEELKGGAEV